MRIFGIDPGTAITGYGVVEKNRGELVHIAHGCITTKKDAKKEKRLLVLEKELLSLLKEYRPDAVAVESLFFFKNLQSFTPFTPIKTALPANTMINVESKTFCVVSFISTPFYWPLLRTAINI